jgi:hypothetical protein
MRDDTAPHQIRLIYVGQKIAVTCMCIQRPYQHGRKVLAKPRTLLPAEEALQIYRAHLAEIGAEGAA